MLKEHLIGEQSCDCCTKTHPDNYNQELVRQAVQREGINVIDSGLYVRDACQAKVLHCISMNESIARLL